VSERSGGSYGHHYSSSGGSGMSGGGGYADTRGVYDGSGGHGGGQRLPSMDMGIPSIINRSGYHGR
jgi:hypothetical protein